MKMDIVVRGRQVQIGSRTIELPHPVVQTLWLGSLLIVRVEPAPGQLFNSNVFALDTDAQQVWQIAESPHGTEVDKPFMDLRINHQGELFAGNWNGVEYRVHPATGELSVAGFDK